MGLGKTIVQLCVDRRQRTWIIFSLFLWSRDAQQWRRRVGKQRLLPSQRHRRRRSIVRTLCVCVWLDCEALTMTIINTQFTFCRIVFAGTANSKSYPLAIKGYRYRALVVHIIFALVISFFAARKLAPMDVRWSCATDTTFHSNISWLMQSPSGDDPSAETAYNDYINAIIQLKDTIAVDSDRQTEQ